MSDHAASGGKREAIVRAIWRARPGEWTGDGAQVRWEEASEWAKGQAYEAADAVLAAIAMCEKHSPRRGPFDLREGDHVRFMDGATTYRVEAGQGPFPDSYRITPIDATATDQESR